MDQDSLGEEWQNVVGETEPKTSDEADSIFPMLYRLLCYEFRRIPKLPEIQRGNYGNGIVSPDEPVDTNTFRRVDELLVKSAGLIVIPATSFVDPRRPSRNVLVMSSFLGGDQLHLESDGKVEYELPPSITTAGKFALSVKVVNVHRNQKPLLVDIEKAFDTECSSLHTAEAQDIDGYEMLHLSQSQEIEVQYTKGFWEYTKSIRVDLCPRVRLKLSRNTPCWGLTMKEIVLQPI